MAPLDNTGSSLKSDIKDQYEQWAKAHERIKNSPPQEGRCYLRHAKNLLPLLEGFAEMNPFAKAAVASFKAIIFYEDDRQENDTRVEILFLSQSEIMSTLLDMDQLSKGRETRLEKKGLHSGTRLTEILLEVEHEITACENTIDTYYKEKRIVKFFKSQEWKNRVAAHATNLDRFRARLQQELSIQVASDTATVLNKLDILLLRLFAPKADWEKEMAKKVRQHENRKALINDNASLEMLVAITKDPLLVSNTTEKDNMNMTGSKAPRPTQIEQVRKEIQTPLDVLCERNKEMFTRKLEESAHQMRESISNAAQYVVESLSGPHDRLHNEDLKILWKEMKWIFCVDNKLFASALFEYYLDHFSTVRQKSNPVATQAENEDTPSLSNEIDLERVRENVTKVDSLSHSGNLSHADAWTLTPIAKYGHRVSSAIDGDESGFIRISEANIFTGRMPEGWTLPQWCAYVALGEAYEARIYRRRIHNVLFCMMEMQAKVLPLNRRLIISTVPYIVPFFQLIAWDPTASKDYEHCPSELCVLVREKMKQQDARWRQKLASYNWAVDDTIIQLIFGKCPPEAYMLQLSFLLLEYAYDVMQACCIEIIDIKEMGHILSPLYVLQGICMNQIASLRRQNVQTPQNNLETFQFGIWYALDRVYNAELPPPFQPVDVIKFRDDENVLDEFPLRPLAEGHLPLKYKTWKQHIESIPDAEKTPESIPETSWNAGDEDAIEDKATEDYYGLRSNWINIPLTVRTCNKCGKSPIQDYYYVCTICKDFDLCSKCWQLPAEEHVDKEHEFSHLMLRFALHTESIQRDWLCLEARVMLHFYQLDICTLFDDIVSQNEGVGDAGEVKVDSPFSCSECKKTIPLVGTTPFYGCLKYSCSFTQYFICDSCDHKDVTTKDPHGHQWWHPQLVLRRNTIVVIDDIPSISFPADQSQENVDQKTDYAVVVSEIRAKFSEIVAKLDATNSLLQENQSSNHAEYSAVNAEKSETKRDQGADATIISTINVKLAEIEAMLDSTSEMREQGTQGRDSTPLSAINNRLSEVATKLDSMLKSRGRGGDSANSEDNANAQESNQGLETKRSQSEDETNDTAEESRRIMDSDKSSAQRSDDEDTHPDDGDPNGGEARSNGDYGRPNDDNSEGDPDSGDAHLNTDDIRPNEGDPDDGVAHSNGDDTLPNDDDPRPNEGDPNDDDARSNGDDTLPNDNDPRPNEGDPNDDDARSNGDDTLPNDNDPRPNEGDPNDGDARSNGEYGWSNDNDTYPNEGQPIGDDASYDTNDARPNDDYAVFNDEDDPTGYY